MFSPYYLESFANLWQVDRLSPERLSRVGQIEVECWSAELKSRIWKQRKNPLEFVQANKKDSDNVTRGILFWKYKSM